MLSRLLHLLSTLLSPSSSLRPPLSTLLLPHPAHRARYSNRQYNRGVASVGLRRDSALLPLPEQLLDGQRNRVSSAPHRAYWNVSAAGVEVLTAKAATAAGEHYTTDYCLASEGCHDDCDSSQPAHFEPHRHHHHHESGWRQHYNTSLRSKPHNPKAYHSAATRPPPPPPHPTCTSRPSPRPSPPLRPGLLPRPLP